MKDSLKHNGLDVSSILSKAGFALFFLLSLNICCWSLLDAEQQAMLSNPT